MIFVFKVAGALVETGASLQDVCEIALETNSNIRTLGVALSPVYCLSGKPTFEINDDEIEIGMGIHGEPGISREKLKSANDLTDDICNRILADFNLSDQEIGLMINSLGATPLEELYIVSRRVIENFNKK